MKLSGKKILNLNKSLHFLLSRKTFTREFLIHSSILIQKKKKKKKKKKKNLYDLMRSQFS